MRGDRWHRAYWKTPRPACCEWCGARSGEQYGRELPWIARIYWDHCHKHLIVRGALCNSCNAEEGRDLAALTADSKVWLDGQPGLVWRPDNAWTPWRMRCHECWPPLVSRGAAA